MSDLTTQPLRIIAPEPDAAPTRPAPAALAKIGFDYAALARKARTAREARAAARRRQAAAADAGHRRRVRDASMAEDRTGVDTQACTPCDRLQTTMARKASEPADDEDADPLGAEVAGSVWPVICEVSRVADAFAVVLVSLAREVAAFCAVPAIGQGGRWEARVPLDEHRFPHTTLHLRLSPTELSLRFDCRDPTVRQLLCDHEAALKRELGSLMDAWAETRAIEISTV